MSWTNCQLKMRLVDIKHPCKMKVEYQNYLLYHDLLYLPNFARLEKFNYVHAFQLPTLSPRSPFHRRSAFFLFVWFWDLTFLIILWQINLSSATNSGIHYGIPNSFVVFAWQSYVVPDNSAWCVTVDRRITASMHGHLLRGVAQRGSLIEGLGGRL